MLFSITPTMGYTCTFGYHHRVSSSLFEMQMVLSMPETQSQLNLHSHTMTKLPDCHRNRNFQCESAPMNIKLAGGNEMSSLVPAKGDCVHIWKGLFANGREL